MANPGGTLGVELDSFGARCDGRSIDNEAFSRALQNSSIVILPNRTCTIDSFALPSGVSIIGQTNESRIQSGPTGTAFVIGDGKELAHDIAIRNVTFVAPAAAELSSFGIAATYASNLVISLCKAEEVQLFISNRNVQYGPESVRNLVSDVKFEGNTCVSRQTKAGSCGEFRFVDRVLAQDNQIRGFRHGLFYWGGDAKTDGGSQSKRWATNISFKSNKIIGVGQGGLWGSMGDKVLFANNEIYNVGDVGLDFEGTINGRAVGNKCVNARNGCISTFFHVDKISFENNSIISTSHLNPLARLYNASQNLGNGKVSFLENSFKCEDPIEACTIDDSGGPVGEIDFGRNALSDTTIGFDTNNTGPVFIRKNRLTFSTKLLRPAISIEIFGGNGMLSKNEITSSLVQQGYAAILIRNSDYNHSTTYAVESNSIRSFQTALSLNASGKNIGTRVSFWGCGNDFNGGHIIHDFSSASEEVRAESQLENSCPTL